MAGVVLVEVGEEGGALELRHRVHQRLDCLQRRQVLPLLPCVARKVLYFKLILCE